MKDQTEIAAVEVLQPELLSIVETSGMQLTEAQLIGLKFAPYMAKVTEITMLINALDAENPTPETAALARRYRLDLVENRGSKGLEGTKKEQKQELLIKTGLIDNLVGSVEKSSKLAELKALEIEKHQEKIEAEAKAKLAAERIILLTEYEVETTYLPLGEMTDGQFQAILSKGKEAFEAIQETRRLAEVKRLADEKEAEENERKRLLHNERLQKLTPYLSEENKLDSVDIQRDYLGDLQPDVWEKLFNDTKSIFDKAIAEKEAEDKRIREENEALRLAKEKAEKKADLIAKHNEKITARTNELHKIGLKFDFASTFSGFGFFIDVLDIQTYDDKKWAALISKIETKIEEAENDKILTCSKNAHEAIEFLLSIGYKEYDHGVTHPDYHSSIGAAHYSALLTQESLDEFKAEKLAYDKKQRDQIAADIKNKNLAEENEKLKAKQDAIDLAHEQEKQRIEQEEQEKLAREKAEKSAPDVEKLRGVYTFFNGYVFPEMTTPEGIEAMKQIKGAHEYFLKVIKDEEQKLK